MLLLTCVLLQRLGASLSPSAEPFPLYDPLPVTGVTFDTTDAPLRGLRDRDSIAVAVARVESVAWSRLLRACACCAILPRRVESTARVTSHVRSA